MRKFIVAVGFLMLLAAPAHALTCAQQAQACANKARQLGQPQYAPKCLAASRVAECRGTCVFIGTDGSKWAASGDCKAR